VILPRLTEASLDSSSQENLDRAERQTLWDRAAVRQGVYPRLLSLTPRPSLFDALRDSKDHNNQRYYAEHP
jgi:hypothetical protein